MTEADWFVLNNVWPRATQADLIRIEASTFGVQIPPGSIRRAVRRLHAGGFLEHISRAAGYGLTRVGDRLRAAMVDSGPG